MRGGGASCLTCCGLNCRIRHHAVAKLFARLVNAESKQKRREKILLLTRANSSLTPRRDSGDEHDKGR